MPTSISSPVRDGRKPRADSRVRSAAFLSALAYLRLSSRLPLMTSFSECYLLIIRYLRKGGMLTVSPSCFWKIVDVLWGWGDWNTRWCHPAGMTVTEIHQRVDERDRCLYWRDKELCRSLLKRCMISRWIKASIRAAFGVWKVTNVSIFCYIRATKSLLDYLFGL